MDFIHKIIADRRAARMMAAPPPVDPFDDVSHDTQPVEATGSDVAQVEEAAGAADSHIDAFADDVHIAGPGWAPKIFVAPVWTNPNAAEVPSSLLMPLDEIQEFADPEDVAFRDRPLTVPAPVQMLDEPAMPLAAAPPPPPPAPAQVSTFAGWDRPQPLRSGLVPDMATVPLFDAPAKTTQPLPEPETVELSPAALAFSAPAGPAPSLVSSAGFSSHPGAVESQPDLAEMPYVSARSSRRPTGVLNDAGIQMPPPAAGRGASRAGHVKTRLLGFNPEMIGVADPFEKRAEAKDERFPVGWVVVVAGPGLGSSFVLRDGVARIGRGEDQEICLNFGDNAISRENHVSVAFDSEQNAFYIGQSGRGNIVRLNNKPLLSTEQMRSGDQIRIGETTLRFAALCGEDFVWAQKV